jgi:hypothetical protein
MLKPTEVSMNPGCIENNAISLSAAGMSVVYPYVVVKLAFPVQLSQDQ